jgi:hypothetical protein
MPPLSRRGFLILTALLFPVARLRGAAAAAISVDKFRRLSERLTGRTGLDPGLAATYRNALISAPANIPLLVQLSDGAGARRTAAHVALENTIIEWWYTGVYTLNGEPRVATHLGALMWSALGMPAPGTCASAFGAWSQPPSR